MDRREAIFAALSGAAVIPSLAPRINGSAIQDVTKEGVLDPHERADILASTAVFPEQFGAVGDGLVDDTDALQRAIEFCILNSLNLHLRSTKYLVTKSINATSTSMRQNFWIIGQGKYNTQLLHRFPQSEIFPVLDMCGNSLGGLMDLGIVCDGTSYATCAWLAAKGSNGGSVGNGQSAYRCHFEAGNSIGDCAIVIYNADLSRLVDCSTASNSLAGGASIGFGKPANVTSKFVSIPDQLDWTQGYICRCELIGGCAPALTYSGGAVLVVRDTYCAVTGIGSPHIVEISSPDYRSGNCLFADALRTENQSSRHGVNCLYFTAVSRGGHVIASLETDKHGSMIASAELADVSDYYFKVQGSTGALFSLTAAIISCHIDASAGSAGIGTATNVAGSSGLDFAGTIGLQQIKELFGSIPGLRIRQARLDNVSLNEILFSPANPRMTGRGRMVTRQAAVPITTYRGGGIPKAVLTESLDLASLKVWSSALPCPHLTFELSFRVAGFNAGGRLGVVLSQGRNSAKLAYGQAPQGDTAVKLTLNICGQDDSEMLCAELMLAMGAETKFSLTELQPAGIVPANGFASLSIFFENTSAVQTSGARVICQI